MHAKGKGIIAATHTLSSTCQVRSAAGSLGALQTQVAAEAAGTTASRSAALDARERLIGELEGQVRLG